MKTVLFGFLCPNVIQNTGYSTTAKDIFMLNPHKRTASLLLSLFMLSCSLFGFAQTQNNDAATPLVFSATGDGPRGEEDWGLLRHYFAEEKRSGTSAFVLHTGDICPGSMSPPEEYYQEVAALFRESSIPFFFVPGDNEWNDTDDPDAAYVYWCRSFLGYSQQFENAPRVAWQTEHRENIAWRYRGVLFVGINLVGGTVVDPEEWKVRHADNALWINKQFKDHGPDIRAAVVFAQANPNKKHEDFVAAFAKSAEAFGKPVLFLHGDGHKWQHEPGWRAPNILRVQVDQVKKAPPVEVTVSDDETMPFSFRRPMWSDYDGIQKPSR
jgi:hypothetical protein